MSVLPRAATSPISALALSELRLSSVHLVCGRGFLLSRLPSPWPLPMLQPHWASMIFPRADLGLHSSTRPSRIWLVDPSWEQAAISILCSFSYAQTPWNNQLCKYLFLHLQTMVSLAESDQGLFLFPPFGTCSLCHSYLHELVEDDGVKAREVLHVVPLHHGAVLPDVRPQLLHVKYQFSNVPLWKVREQVRCGHRTHYMLLVLFLEFFP